MNDVMLNQMKTLAASYAPEWRFDERDPDAGSVVALLMNDMLVGSAERFGRVLHKHKIQYLNLFDRFKVEPVEAARGFVKFEPVTGVTEPVHVPKGVRLLADSDKAGQIAFETRHGVTVTPAQIMSIYMTNGADCVISRLFDAQEGVKLEKSAFTAFTPGEENLEEHALLLGFGPLFDHLESLELSLFISTLSEEDKEQTIQELCSKGVRFRVLCGDGFEDFDSVEPIEGGVRLKKERCVPGKMTLSGEEHGVIEISAGQPRAIQVSGFSLCFADGDIIPDEVRCGGVSQNQEHFKPFGTPMEIYASCEMDSRVVCARAGAGVELTFHLDYETVEQLLPEYEMEEEFKVIMKKSPAKQKLAIVDCRADYVLLEYLSGTGWKRLVRDDRMSMLFNGSEKGEVTISFVMPNDILPWELAEEQPRLRLRLLRADNLYRMPCRQLCPVIDHLRFSYRYTDNAITPPRAVTRNNFEIKDVTGSLKQRRNVSLFYSKEHHNRAMYVGFDANPWGTPVSLYFGIENNADYMVDITAEYLSPEGFIPLKTVDGTGGLRCSGAMRLIIPPDGVEAERFGEKRYWVRLINHDREVKPYHLPMITGIHQNMAAVENVLTQTEYFYIDQGEGQVIIQLGGQGLISAQVFVNEVNGTDGENWVSWRRSGSGGSLIGRTYDIDLSAGRITFDRAGFSTFPIKEDGPAVKVVHQSYHGASANLEAGKIATLASSIRHISGASNPMPAYGGYDGLTEETAAAAISHMLRTRGRAVSAQDFKDIISDVSYGIRQVKCLSGIDPQGRQREDAVSIAILIDEYENGSHIFPGVRDAIEEKLLDCGFLTPTGKTLILTQPRFVRMSARLWLECEKMEAAYDAQQQCLESIRAFIDPLGGGYNGTGWEIGTLPTTTQLVAFLKIRHPDMVVGKIVMTALYDDREYEVDDLIGRKIASPFAMAVNGEHIVYTMLSEE